MPTAGSSRDHNGRVDDEAPRIPQHEVADRFGKAALRTVHELTAGLAANDDADEEPVVVRRDAGPHRSLAGLAALIDAALDEEPADRPAEEGPRPPD